MRGLVFVLIVLLAFACNGGGEEGLRTATPAPSPAATATATGTATATPAVAQTPLGPQQPVALEEGVSITEAGAYLAEVATGRLWRLGEGGRVWSPDGNALLSWGCCVGRGGLDVIAVPEGPAVRLVNGDMADAAWSTDGTQIYFSPAEGSLPAGLYAINRDGSGLKQVWNWRSAGIEWSPSGDRIAFWSWDHLKLLDVASGEITEVAADHAAFVAWSPAGRQLAFVSDGGLCLYQPDTGERRQLAAGESGGPVLWSPDGSRIAFPLGPRIAMTYGGYAHDPQVGPRLFQVVEVDGPTEPKPLPPARSPSWSPDGTSVTYLSEGCITGDWDIYTVRPDGSSATPLTNTPDSAKEGPVRSPVGSAIAFSTLDKLMVVDADSRQLRTLAVSDALATIGAPLHLHGSNWSPDGRYITFFVGGAHGICD